MQRHRAFLKHFMDHHASLYGYVVARGVSPAEADDVLQDVAAVLWEKYDSYEEGTNFRAWAFAVVRLELLKRSDRRRRDARVIRLDDEALDELAALEAEEQDERSDLLRGCLDRLGPRARQLVGWRYGDGLDYEAMAGRLSTTARALRVRLCRIRKWLHDCVRSQTAGPRPAAAPAPAPAAEVRP